MAPFPNSMLDALARHWPEYLIEGALLGIFMVAACVAVVILQHPRSPVAGAMECPRRRRVVIGMLMGITAIALIYSPWGQRSGAHMNPGTTLTFFVLGKVQPWDAIFYVASQFLGALLGVCLASITLGHLVAHHTVNYAATLPGPRGLRAAWMGEFAIAFGLMSMVLWSANHAATAPFTGILAGIMVAVYIAIEAPISGMSMNPARTLGSAIPARAFRGLWIYFTAPPLAMLCAAWLYVAIAGPACVYCAKMDHPAHGRCIFNCCVEQMSGREANLPHASGIQQNSGTQRPTAQRR